MSLKIFIIFSLILLVATVLPIWDLKESAIDLLDNTEHTHEYIIHESSMYSLKVSLKKNISINDGNIIHNNYATIYEYVSENNPQVSISERSVEYENIESFYKLTDLRVLCPQKNFNVINLNDNLNEIQFNNWTNENSWDLKCYYHRMGYFLVYYLMNGKNQIQAYKESTKSWEIYNDIQIGDEIYDFKLENKGETGDFAGPFAFMALIKDNNYIKIFGSKYKFSNDGISLDVNTTIELLESKSNNKGYFNTENNTFYYFSYNNISDFSSGYSTTPPGDDYLISSEITFRKNTRNPFEFFDEVEIKEINFLMHNKYCYYIVIIQYIIKIIIKHITVFSILFLIK